MEMVMLKLTVRRAPDNGFCIEDEGGELIAARSTLLEASQWLTDKLFETFRDPGQEAMPPPIENTVVMPNIVRQQQAEGAGLVSALQRRIGGRA